MKVLVLNQHYWPEIAATGQLLEDVCEDLVARGHDVTVITGQPSYRVSGDTRTLPAEETRRGVRIRRVWSYVPRERSIPRRVFAYGSYFASSLVAAVRDAKPDVALVLSTPPLLLGVSGALHRALRGVPYVYSVQDLYPDIAINLGVLKPGLAATAIDHVARRLYRGAAGIITLSGAMADRLVEKGVDAERIAIIPNWADTDAVRPTPRDNAYARENGLVDSFVVQYSGNVGLSQGLEHVVAAAAHLRDLPITLAIVGGGNARASLERQAKEQQLTNVRFFEPAPRDRLGELLASADVSLVPMKRGVASDLVPSKLYGILAASKPVLASVEHDSEVGRVVRQFDCGRVVEPENAKALADAIRELHAQRENLHAMGERGRRAGESHFSRRVCTGRYETALAKAAGFEARVPAPASSTTEGAHP
ncbi:MAG: glycosyltransferase family 4 protein [Polyangiales bacterium]|nr:glycosyltransferase family 4 protein [Myxococcales bacterium]